MNERKCFVQLGRFGDIINVLPLALEEYQRTGIKPLVQVAEKFAGIMDGVGYADPLVFHDDFRETVKAIFEARKATPNVVICQIYGKGLIHREDCTSFARQSWAHGGAQATWGSLPLVFDRRDAQREAELCAGLGFDLHEKAGKKVVLLVTGGISSPFPHGKWLEASLPGLLGPDYVLININSTPVHRLYDLLGAMDRAHCLITTDTATLHLAHASGVPVVSLINKQPAPWHGSPWRAAHVGRFFYDEFPGCIVAVAEAVCQARAGYRPTILHAYADFRDGPMDEDTSRRCAVARESWRAEYEVGKCWAPCELVKNDARRDARQIGDGPLPFARDLIENAVRMARRGSDIIALTNADVCFAPGLTGRILEVVGRHGAAFTHRWDFPRLVKPFVSESQVGYGAWYPGSDALFFTVNWWADHGSEFGDYVMGREHWDQALRFLIKFYGGEGIEKVIYHEKHASAWEQPGARDTLPGNLHNRALFNAYADRLGVRGSDWLWWKAIERAAIYKHG